MAARPASQGAALAADAAAAAEDDIPPEGMEFCGAGRVSAAQLRQWKQDPEVGRAWIEQHDGANVQRAQEALTALAARLAAGGERQQVAARLLMSDREGAAALAVASTDPLAYQLAYQSCGASQAVTRSPGCGQLSATRWAALDPTDARPWLDLLAQAHRANDGPGIDAALSAVAARPRLSRQGFLLVSHLLPVLPPGMDPVLRVHVLAQAVGIDMASVSLGSLPWRKVCTDARLATAGRAATCQAAARQLLAGANDLWEAVVAQKLADQLGVPKAEQAHSAATLQAAQRALSERALQGVGADCASLKAMSDVVARQASEGELAMALSLLPAPPAR